MSVGQVGLVMAGAAARGAYEAGALSVLIPELDRLGKRPTVLVGSSAGGINAFLLAQYSDLAAKEAVEEIVKVWAGIKLSSVIGPILPAALETGVISIAEFLGIPGVRLYSFFDTRPLRDTVKRHFDAKRLHQNIQSGLVSALALAATAPNGRTTVFVEAKESVPLPSDDDERAIDYVRAEITVDHVLASAAIPVLFPPIWVDNPPASGWYRDGLVRLNAPIKPALALGATQLALVASEPDKYPDKTLPLEPGPAKEEEPDIEDGGAQLLHAVLADHMVEDMLRFHKVNRLLERLANQQKKARSEVKLSKKNGDSNQNGDSYNFVDSIFAGPYVQGILGEKAEKYWNDHHRDEWAFLSTFALLGRLLGNNSKSRGELLSWLLFEPDFLKEIIRMGQEDAAQRLYEADHSTPKAFPYN